MSRTLHSSNQDRPKRSRSSSSSSSFPSSSSPARSTRSRRSQASDFFDDNINNENQSEEKQLLMDIEEKKMNAPRRGRKRSNTSISNNANNNLVDDANQLIINPSPALYSALPSTVSDSSSVSSNTNSNTSFSISKQQYDLLLEEIQRLKNQSSPLPPPTGLSLAPPPPSSSRPLIPSTPISPSSSSMNNSSPLPLSNIEYSYSKHALKIKDSKDLPRWNEPTKDNPSVIPYLKKVENFMKNFEGLLPRDQWYRIISVDKHKVGEAMEERLVTQVLEAKPTWEDLKQLMIATFDRKDYSQVLDKRLHELRQGSSTVSQYNSEFTSIMAQLNYDYDNKALTGIYFNGLTKMMQEKFKEKKSIIEANDLINHSSTPADFTDLFTVMQLCQKISYDHEEQHSSSNPSVRPHPKIYPVNYDRNKFNKFDRNTKPHFIGAKYCDNHGWCKHSSRECHRPQSSNNNNSTNNSSIIKKYPVCIICNGPHYANQCINRSGSYNRSVPSSATSNSTLSTSSTPTASINSTNANHTSGNPWQRQKQIGAQIRQLKLEQRMIRQGSQQAKVASSTPNH
jgi:hypothetical protein